jgi:hypothetical protein
MRTRTRTAVLALALAAVAVLPACTSSVAGEATLLSSPAPEATPDATPEPADDPDPEGPTEQSVPSGTGGDDLPVPGDGVSGDAGLCQAVAGWFGYAGLALISVDETGYVDPAAIVPLLAAMRDAPADHQDAGAPLLAAAGEVSAAADVAIADLEAGTDAFVVFEELSGPVTVFGEACTAAGVSV